MTDDVANNANAGDPPDRVIYQSGLQFPDPVGKKITRRADGSVTKEHQDAVRSGGALVLNERFRTATEAFDFRCNAGNRVMGFSGTFAHEFGTDDGYHAVPNKARRDVQDLFDASEWRTIVSPTKSFLQHREGGGMLSIDVDPKFLTDPKVFGMYPETPMVLKTADEVLSAFLQIVPEAEGCAILVVPSSSSMIADAATGEMVLGPGGWRILVPVDEARQIPRLLETIHRRCWAKEEFRYAYINEPGAFYPRSLADTALKAPTQPDFFAAELCDELGDGLAVSPDGVLGVNEEADQWLVACSVKLSDEDDRLAGANIEKVRAILKPIIDRQHGQAVGSQVEKLVEAGVPRPTAEKAAKKRFAGGTKRGVLSGSDLIFLGSGSDGVKGGMITAGVLLTRDGLQYDGMLCLDPQDPGYDGGRATGKIYWNGGLKPVIHSFAHGPKTWDIEHDAASLAKVIEADAADAEAISLAFEQADLDAVEYRQLLNKAAKGLGLGNERQSLKDSIARQKARIAEYMAEHAAAGGGHPDGGEAVRDGLLASIGLAAGATAEQILTRHFELFAFDQEAKAIVRLDNPGYTASPREQNDIWAPCRTEDGKACISQVWMVATGRRLTVEGSRMRPDMPFPLYDEAGKTWRNTYRPAVHPASGGDVGVFIEFMESLLVEDVEREWFRNWLAHKRRLPAVRMTAVIMVAITRDGDQSFGTGRGTLFKIIEKLFGLQYVRPASFSDITGGDSQAAYNDYLEGLIVLIEEAASKAGDLKYHDRRAAYEALKDFDTSPANKRIKPKYGKIKDIVTYASGLVATNHANPVALPPGDRRFTVLKNGPRMADALLDRVYAWMADPRNIGALARWLDARDLSAFQPYKPLETATKDKMMLQGLSGIDHLLKEAKGALPGRAFIPAQLRAWVHANAGDDPEVAGEGVWDRQLAAAIRQRCVVLRNEKGNPRRVSLGKNRRAIVHCWAGDEDELASAEHEWLVDEVVKNNQPKTDFLVGVWRSGATVEKEDNLSAEVVDLAEAKEAKERKKPL